MIPGNHSETAEACESLHPDGKAFQVKPTAKKRLSHLQSLAGQARRREARHGGQVPSGLGHDGRKACCCFRWNLNGGPLTSIVVTC